MHRLRQEREDSDVLCESVAHADDVNFLLNSQSLHNYRIIEKLTSHLAPPSFFQVEDSVSHREKAAARIRARTEGGDTSMQGMIDAYNGIATGDESPITTAVGSRKKRKRGSKKMSGAPGAETADYNQHRTEILRALGAEEEEVDIEILSTWLPFNSSRSNMSSSSSPASNNPQYLTLLNVTPSTTLTSADSANPPIQIHFEEPLTPDSLSSKRRRIR